MKWLFFVCSLLLNIGISQGQGISADKNLQKAHELLDQNRDDEALEHLNECLVQQSNNKEALFLRARILNNKKEFLSALTDYNKVIALDPENKEAFYNRGIVKYQLGQYQSAIKDFELCMDLPSRETSTAYFKTDPGKRQVIGISTISGMDIELWNYIGLCNYHLSEYTSAIDAFNQGLFIENGNTDLIVNRALCNEKKGNYAMAKSDYQLVLMNNPDHKLALLNLSRLASSENQLPELDNFINKYPDQPVGYEDRGLAYFELEIFDAAELDFIKALELQPDNSEYAFNLALTKIKLDKLTGAENLLIDLSKEDPQNHAIFFNLGNIKYKLAHFEEAISYYTLSISMDNKNASYLYNRALAYYENMQMHEACADIDQAQIIEPGIGAGFKKQYCEVNE